MKLTHNVHISLNKKDGVMIKCESLETALETAKQYQEEGYLAEVEVIPGGEVVAL